MGEQKCSILPPCATNRLPYSGLSLAQKRDTLAIIERKKAMDTAVQFPSTYLTTEELAARIKYDVRTIRDQLKDSVLLEGIHYIRPFGRRKILFIWEAIQRDMQKMSHPVIPMANGGVCRG
jgi:hypothetical protein